MRAALVAGAVAGCVIPPSQSTLGAVATSRGPGTRASIGAHAVALDDRDRADVDLGAGWIGEWIDGAPRGDAVYVALARRVTRALWLGGRAEQGWGGEGDAASTSAVARALWRRPAAAVRWASAGGGSALGVLGAIAGGAYLDVGVRRGGGAVELFTAAGVSLELPAIAGAGR